VTLDDISPAEHALFNERGARAIVSVSPTNLAAVLATARQCEVAAREIGKVHFAPSLRIEYKGLAGVDSSLDSLRDTWANSLELTLARQ
jgi:phosphoribosylformylglycinamidine (FGAM) synthase-like enzyme